MVPRARLLALTVCLLALPLAPASAMHPVACAMHQPHTGAHERASCGLTKLGAVEVSEVAGIGQIEVRGGLAAVVQRDDGLVALVDVSDPTSPRVVGRYDGNTGRPELDDPLDGDVAFSHDGRFLFYARQTNEFSNDGLHVIDISTPSQPVRVDYVPGGGTLRVAYHRAAGVEYVITLDAVAGLVVFRFERAGPGAALVPVYVDALPQLKVGGPGSAGLFVDPSDPKLGKPLLYVSTSLTGVQVFDFSMPERPVLLGSWGAQEGLADIEVRATPDSRTVYAATQYRNVASPPAPRIVVLDATDLAAIKEVARISPGDPDYPAGVMWRVQGIELANGLLYVAHSHAGLGVLETCCLEAPRAATTDLGEGNKDSGFASIAPYAMDVAALSGDVLLVSDASTGTLSAFRLDPVQA
jgi:hypothetical protein